MLKTWPKSCKDLILVSRRSKSKNWQNQTADTLLSHNYQFRQINCRLELNQRSGNFRETTPVCGEMEVKSLLGIPNYTQFDIK